MSQVKQLSEQNDVQKTATDRVEIVPIDTVFLDPANVRRHPERNLQMIAASLKRFGQQRPILVDSDGLIIAGNGTWQAAKSIGWDSIKVEWSNLKGVEAVAYAIADNRTTDTSSFDDDDLMSTLDALAQQEAPLGADFWTDAELKALAKILEDEPVDTSQVETPEQFIILVECANEREQVALLERFNAEGLQCKALL